jgi:putative acetyltransferase
VPPAATPTVRPVRPADSEPARQLLTAAFGRPSVAELAAELRGSDAHRAALAAELPTGSKSAELPTGDQSAVPTRRLAGLVQLSRGWLDAPPRLAEVLVLSPLAVLPQLHGRGIGATLVRSAIAMAERLGAPLLFLEGSPRYYPRFGFVPGRERGFLRPSVRIPEAAFQVMVLPGWQDWMVGALVYPEAFWRHDAVGLRELTQSPGQHIPATPAEPRRRP